MRAVTFALVSFSCVSWLRKYNTTKRGAYFVNTLHICNTLVPWNTPPGTWAPTGVVFLQGLHNITWICHMQQRRMAVLRHRKESESAIIDAACSFQVERVALGVTLYTCAREMLCFNFGRDTSSLDWGFLWFSSVCPVKWLDSSSIRLRPLPSKSIHHHSSVLPPPDAA
jgi:hypothetical protein